MTELKEELARAATMLDLGRYDEASTLLARLVSAEPGSGRAWCLFARAHLGADRFTEAVEAANRAAAIEPTEEWPHRLASNALMHLGNHGEALRAAAESRRLAPAYWQTHVCVAQAALAAGQPATAAAEVRPSLGTWFETARNVALFANEGGAYDDLVAYLRKRRLI